ncbi:Nn.00g076750.m01.CDS01 [Neocucurbitaria sp. VM-36]
MADNVGLTTPRGSGTSGYVQKNRSLLRPRDKVAPYPKDWESAKHRPRQPDAEILEHEAKREIEVKVLELRDKLEDEGVDEDEIDDQCEALRRKLGQERKDGKELGPNAKRLKSHQVHDLAKAKIEESERLRKALGISADYEEGSHWRKQEERMRESLAKREAEDEDKVERAKEARRYKEEDSD